MEAPQHEIAELPPIRDHPRPSVESDLGLFYSDNEEDINEPAPTVNGPRGRSETRESLVVVEQSRTGLDEFDMDPKSESPELGLPPPQHTTPRAPGTGKKMRKTRSDKGKKRGPRNPASPERAKGSSAKLAAPATAERSKRARRLSKDAPVEPSSELPRWTNVPDTTAANGTPITSEWPGRLPRVFMLASANKSSAKRSTWTEEAESAPSHAVPHSTSRPGRPSKAAQSLLSKGSANTVKRRGRPRKFAAPFVTTSDDESEIGSPKPTATSENLQHSRRTRGGSHEKSPDNASQRPTELEFADLDSDPKGPASKNMSGNANHVACHESPSEDGFLDANDNAVGPEPTETELAETHDASVGAEQAEADDASVRSEPAEDEDVRDEVEPTEDGDASMGSDSAEEHDARIEVEPTEDGDVSVRSDLAEDSITVVGTKLTQYKDSLAKEKSSKDDDASIRAEPAEDDGVAGGAGPSADEIIFVRTNHAKDGNVSQDTEPVEADNDPVDTTTAELEKGPMQPEPRMTRKRTGIAQGRIAVAQGSIASTRGRTAAGRGRTVANRGSTAASRGRKAAGQDFTAEREAGHREVMNLMYPNGNDIPKVSEGLAELYQKTKSKSPETQKRSNLAKNAIQHTDEDLKGESQPQSPVPASRRVRDSAKFDSSDKDPIEDSQLSPAKLVATTSNTKPWNSESWGFQNVDQPNGTVKKVEPERASASMSQPNPLHKESQGTTDSEPEQELADMNFKSNSVPNSARSSPEATRRPARYLSRSPTSDKSSSDEESETSQSPSHSRAGSPGIADPQSESDSDDSSNEAEDEEVASGDEESEYEDAKEPPTRPKPPELPSSPPRMPSLPTTLVPATQSSQLPSRSQPPPRGTPAIPSSNTPLATASQPTPSRRPLPRFATSHMAYQFGTISDQLKEVRARHNSVRQTAKFDAKTQNLGRLKNGNANVNGFGESGSSDDDDDDDESSSSSEEEDLKGKGRASCSVT